MERDEADHQTGRHVGSIPGIDKHLGSWGSRVFLLLWGLWCKSQATNSCRRELRWPEWARSLVLDPFPYFCFTTVPMVRDNFNPNPFHPMLVSCRLVFLWKDFTCEEWSRFEAEVMKPNIPLRTTFTSTSVKVNLPYSKLFQLYRMD